MSQFDFARRRLVRAFSRSPRLHVATLVGVALSVLLVVRAGLPRSVDASDAASVKDSTDEVTLRVTQDDHTLEFNGPIVVGVTARMREVLDAHRDITTVRLTSPGGRVVEARELGEMIAARRLTTVAAGNCASACTVMFMAGRDRLLAPSSTLGFHRYRAPDPDEAEENMAIDRRYLGGRGVPAWFVDRVFTTPNSGMWRPSPKELKAANVITGELTADGQRIAVTVTGPAEIRPDGAARGDGDLSVHASETHR